MMCPIVDEIEDMKPKRVRCTCGTHTMEKIGKYNFALSIACAIFKYPFLCTGDCLFRATDVHMIDEFLEGLNLKSNLFDEVMNAFIFHLLPYRIDSCLNKSVEYFQDDDLEIKLLPVFVPVIIYIVPPNSPHCSISVSALSLFVLHSWAAPMEARAKKCRIIMRGSFI